MKERKAALESILFASNRCGELWEALLTEGRDSEADAAEWAYTELRSVLRRLHRRLDDAGREPRVKTIGLVTECEKHSTAMTHATREEAEVFAAHPETWCSECEDEAR